MTDDLTRAEEIAEQLEGENYVEFCDDAAALLRRLVARCREAEAVVAARDRLQAENPDATVGWMVMRERPLPVPDWDDIDNDSEPPKEAPDAAT